MKNFVQEGNIITVAAPYAVSSGGGALVGSLFGVAVTSAGNGEDVPLRTTGVVTITKEAGASKAIALGGKVYWDNTNKRATVTSSGNSLIGGAVMAAGDNDTTVTVRLDGTTV